MTNALRSSMFIDGEWLAHKGHTVPVINPADESLIGEAPVASQAEAEFAIAAAREAFDHGIWPRMSTRERVTALEKLHAYLLDKKREIMALITAEAGATAMLAEFLHFDIPMKHARRLMDDALLIQPDHIPIELTPQMDGSKTLGTGTILYEPVGVVAAITPYNFPFFLNLVKIYHALVMGNTVVLKPSPLTPFEAFLFGDAALAAGLPRGVLNIVNGDIDTGQLLSTDERVDMVTFTGSEKVGASIVVQAAPTLKRTHIELGGKSAMIVRHDADIQAAAAAGLGNFTTHCGQGCALMTRHLVHNAVRQQYVETMAAMAGHIKVGNPSDPSVTMGPLIREIARSRVENFVAAEIESGAKLVCGGKRPEGLDRGFYYEPTFFDDVDNSSTIAQQEVFGPVALVIGFDSDEEAIDIANHSDFGLAGAIMTRDAGLAYEMALQLRTGGVAINEGAGTMLSSAPFGGYKRSGYGREYGRHGLLEFTEIKAVTFHAG
jgi:aldehyde dehydrogenase (NAD+)